MNNYQNKINEFADFCLEAFFDGAVNLENINEGLPPGFSQNDIQSVEDFVGGVPPEGVGEAKDKPEPLLTKKDKGVETPDEDEFNAILKKKADVGGKANHETPYIHRSTFTVVGDDNLPINLDKLQKTISQRPTKILQGNTKISKSGGKKYSFHNLTLPAYRGLWFDEKNKEFKFVTTCPSAGECKLVCYARKGGYVQYSISFVTQTKVLNFLLNDWKGFKNQLVNEIQQAKANDTSKGLTTVIRWHDSGDFFNEKYLQIALDIARDTPDIIHYAYTKSVGMVSKADKPKNFIFNFSKGGLEDKSIKPNQKKSIIVPKSIFKDLFQTKPDSHWLDWNKISSDNLNVLKQRLSTTYKVPAESIITYNQLQKIPYDPNNVGKQKYNVIVWPGAGDDSASRADVLTTFLLIH